MTLFKCTDVQNNRIYINCAVDCTLVDEHLPVPHDGVDGWGWRVTVTHSRRWFTYSTSFMSYYTPEHQTRNSSCKYLYVLELEMFDPENKNLGG